MLSVYIIWNSMVTNILLNRWYVAINNWLPLIFIWCILDRVIACRGAYSNTVIGCTKCKSFPVHFWYKLRKICVAFTNTVSVRQFLHPQQVCAYNVYVRPNHPSNHTLRMIPLTTKCKIYLINHKIKCTIPGYNKQRNLLLNLFLT